MAELHDRPGPWAEAAAIVPESVSSLPTMAALKVRLLRQTLIDSANEADILGSSYFFERIGCALKELHAIASVDGRASHSKPEVGDGRRKRVRHLSVRDLVWRKTCLIKIVTRDNEQTTLPPSGR